MAKMARILRNWFDSLSRSKQKAKRTKIVGLYADIHRANDLVEHHNEALLELARSEFTYKVLLRRITDRLQEMGDASAITEIRTQWLKRLTSCQQGLAVIRRKINNERKRVRKAEAKIQALSSKVDDLVAGAPRKDTAGLKRKIQLFEAKCATLKQSVSRAFTANSKFYDGNSELKVMTLLAKLGFEKNALQGA